MNLRLEVHKKRLQLEHPFTISRTTRTVQDTVIVSITDGQVTGYGEAIAYAYYNITIAGLMASLKLVEEDIALAFELEPQELWNHIEPKLRDNYFALCAIDCAFWDYYAKTKRRTTRSFFENENGVYPLSNYTIGIDSVEVMKQKIRERPWPIYKIKLGTKADVEIIKSLREVTNAVFRVDANCAWGAEETLRNAEAMQKLGVEFIEQPLAADNWKGMAQVKAHCVLPVIADESCQRLEDVSHCAKYFNGINIKLMKCGGITPALKMIEMARNRDIKVMAGCMAESSVGISSLCQIASLLDYIDADGAMLFKNDTVKGVQLIAGKIVFNSNLGSGVTDLLM